MAPCHQLWGFLPDVFEKNLEGHNSIEAVLALLYGSGKIIGTAKVKKKTVAVMSRRDSARDQLRSPRNSEHIGERKKLLYVGDEEAGDHRGGHSSYQATQRPSTPTQQDMMKKPEPPKSETDKNAQ